MVFKANKSYLNPSGVTGLQIALFGLVKRLPVVQETGVQSQVEFYQRHKN